MSITRWIRNLLGFAVIAWMLLAATDPTEAARSDEQDRIRGALRGDPAWMHSAPERKPHLALLWGIDLGVELDVPWSVLLGQKVPTWLFAGMFLLTAVEWAHAKLRSKRAPRLVGSDHVPEVLYLREFATDEPPRSMQYTNFGWGARLADPNAMETFDAEVCDHFRAAGRITAIIRKVEGRPVPTGPDDLRVIAPDDDWKDVVGPLVGRARIVVLVAGDGDSILWELGAALQSVSRGRLVLVAPTDGISDTVWSAVRSSLQTAGIDAPETLAAGTRALLITKDGKAKPYVGDFAMVDARKALLEGMRTEA